MTTVKVRVPLKPGMTADDVLVAALSVYLRKDAATVRGLIATQDVRTNRPLNDNDRRRPEIDITLQLSGEVIETQRARVALELDGLPARVQELLFAGGVPPADIPADQVDDYARIIDRLAGFSDADREDYFSQTAGATTDPVEMARALDAFAARKETRAGIASARQASSERLLGVFDRAEKLRSDIGLIGAGLTELERNPQTADGAEAGKLRAVLAGRLEEARAGLTALLEASGYEGVEDYRKDVEAFQTGWRDEAVMMAEDGLNRLDSQLGRDRAALADPAQVDAIFAALDPARKLAEEAAKVRADGTELYDAPGGGQRPIIDDAAAKKSAELFAKARDEVRRLAGDYPALGRGKDDEASAIAGARSAAALKKVLDGQIAATAEDSAQLRSKLAEDPEVVWKLDGLVESASQGMGLRADGEAVRMVAQKVETTQSRETMTDMLLGGLALVGGLFTGGGSTAAVVAGGTLAVGAGGISAAREIDRYQTQNSANNLGLASEDPNLLWALLALIGVGLDAGGAIAALRSAPKLAAASKALGKGTGDLGEVKALLEAETSLSAAQKQALLEAAQKLQAETAAFEAVRAGIGGGKRLVMEAGNEAQLVAEIAFSVHGALGAGGDGLEAWLSSPAARSLVGEMAQMSPEELTVIKAAYQGARKRIDALREVAQGAGLSDAELGVELLAWAKAPAASPAEVAAALKAKGAAKAQAASGTATTGGGTAPKPGGGAPPKPARPAVKPEQLDRAQKLLALARGQKAAKITPENAVRIADLAHMYGLKADDLKDALNTFANAPGMTVDEFAGFLPLYKTPVDEAAGAAVKGGGASKGALRVSDPVQARGTVYNTTAGRAKMAAPPEVLDEASRQVLSGHRGASVTEDFAGTGGIQKISAVPVAGNTDGAVRVSIEGEILPGRLQRDPKVALKPGQSRAPNFNSMSDSVQPKLKDLGLTDPEAWARLHLWGPGFGDEAMAGMFLGPSELNLEWQNSGIEELIRELGRQVAAHADKGYELKLVASVETWGRVSPGGFATTTGEQVVKDLRYELRLKGPDGKWRNALVELTLDTDPALINAGTKPLVLVDIAHDAFRELFDLLPH